MEWCHFLCAGNSIGSQQSAFIFPSASMWIFSFNFKQYKTPAGSILQNLSGKTAWQHLSGPFFFCWDEKAPPYNWVYFLNPRHTAHPRRQHPAGKVLCQRPILVYYSPFTQLLTNPPTQHVSYEILKVFRFAFKRALRMELHFQLQDYRKDSHWWSCYSSSMFAKWKILWTTGLMAGCCCCWGSVQLKMGK